MLYSDSVLRYCPEPAHGGQMESPPGAGQVGGIIYGDFFVMFIRVDNERFGESGGGSAPPGYRPLSDSAGMAGAGDMCR